MRRALARKIKSTLKARQDNHPPEYPLSPARPTLMFFLPLYDENPSSRTPFITWAIMAACVIVFLYQAALDERAQQLFILSYGAIPALVTGHEIRPDAFGNISNHMTVLTSVFMHGGWLHLGGNMLYLWIFGDNIEDSMGHIKFTIFYLICGTVATLTHIAFHPASITPLVGASGAIAGILAAYLMLYPYARIRVMILILFFVRWTSFPAIAVLAGWVIIQFLSLPASFTEGAGVAYLAHIGGFLTGLALTPLLKRPGQPIFPRHTAPHKPPESKHKESKPTESKRKNAFVERYRLRPRPEKTARQESAKKQGTSLPTHRRER